MPSIFFPLSHIIIWIISGWLVWVQQLASLWFSLDWQSVLHWQVIFELCPDKDHLTGRTVLLEATEKFARLRRLSSASFLLNFLLELRVLALGRCPGSDHGLCNIVVLLNLLCNGIQRTSISYGMESCHCFYRYKFELSEESKRHSSIVTWETPT